MSITATPTLAAATPTFATDPEPTLSALIIPPETGKTFTAFGDVMLLKLGDAETGGAWRGAGQRQVP